MARDCVEVDDVTDVAVGAALGDPDGRELPHGTPSHPPRGT